MHHAAWSTALSLAAAVAPAAAQVAQLAPRAPSVVTPATAGARGMWAAREVRAVGDGFVALTVRDQPTRAAAAGLPGAAFDRLADKSPAALRQFELGRTSSSPVCAASTRGRSRASPSGRSTTSSARNSRRPRSSASAASSSGR